MSRCVERPARGGCGRLRAPASGRRRTTSPRDGPRPRPRRAPPASGSSAAPGACRCWARLERPRAEGSGWSGWWRWPRARAAAPARAQRRAAARGAGAGRARGENERGEFFLVEERASASSRCHGDVPLSRFRALRPDTRGRADRRAVAGAVRPSRPRAVFLDTETTGLAGGAGTAAFLIGVGFVDGDRFRVRQYFMRDYHEEAALLRGLAEDLRGFRASSPSTAAASTCRCSRRATA